jgi:hypothetical protein
VNNGTFLKGKEKNFRYYLVLMNINTKYLFFEPLEENVYQTLDITRSVVRSINEKLKKKSQKICIQYFRGEVERKFCTMIAKYEDQTRGLWSQYKKANRNGVILGEMTFVANSFTLFCKDSGISLFLNSSTFINKSRVINRAIRTIRYKIGENSALMLDPLVTEKVVREYNNTKNSAFYNSFTPNQVQNNGNLKEYFIQEHQLILDERNKEQHEAGYFNYKTSNILLIHVDLSKTSDRFKKHRRVFNQLAKFIEYDHGNITCAPLNMNGNYYPDILYKVRFV